MNVKTLFAVAVAAAIALGFALPEPSKPPERTASQIEVLELG